jgi:hypothetical protein
MWFCRSTLSGMLDRPFSPQNYSSSRIKRS